MALTMVEQGLSPGDPNSFSRPDLAIVQSLHLALDVDFVRHVLSGKVNLNVKKLKPEVEELILDVKNITILAILNVLSSEVLQYEIGETVPEIGSKLTIKLPKNNTEEYKLTIYYETSPQADALQWLTPLQTSGKKHPFMFSQGQPIEIRSIIPCQDTPSVKMTYTADITAPTDLTVLMSAQIFAKPTQLQNDTRLHQFYQNVPTPSYLIAIAVGALESRQLGPRSHVWAEKELVDKAQYEFGETEKMLQVAEEICGPYVWGVYDLLVLPPSFAYGGMENPCMTFVTPTLLAGDRSLANVVAHEISHSWTGNLVTNANFEHFWLNEGFTTFIERKIVGRLKDAKDTDFAAVMGIAELEDTLNKMGTNNSLTKLVVNLKGIHPDDAFSKVPYEKGQLFLRYLEQLVGGPNIFEQFLRSYLNKFKYKSIVTDDFKGMFLEYFKDNLNVQNIDWESWLYTPGMPPQLPKLDMSKSQACVNLKNKWIQWTNDAPKCPILDKSDLSSMSVDQICQFLNELNKNQPLSLEQVQTMQEIYNMNSMQNAEIKCRWLCLCLKAHWTDQIEPALKFVTEVGRMKFVNDIYKTLYDWPEARPKAIENFNAHRDEMMYVTQKSISKILHIK